MRRRRPMADAVWIVWFMVLGYYTILLAQCANREALP